TKRKILLTNAIRFQNDELIFVGRPCNPAIVKGYEYMKMVKLEGMSKSAFAHVDFFGWCFRKLDDQRTKLVEFHFADLGSWATTDAGKKMVIGQRGSVVAKMMNEFLKKRVHYTVENQKDKLRQDPFGQLLLANKEFVKYMK